MIKVLAASFVCLFLTVGCMGRKKARLLEQKLASTPLVQRTGLPRASGGFVLAIGGQTITCSEIISPVLEHFRPYAQQGSFEQFKNRAKPELDRIVIRKISDILLYDQAKRDLGEGIDDRLDAIADVEVRKFIVNFGGDYAKAEETLRDMGMNWADFKEYQKKMIVSQSYIHQQLPEQKPVTYNELISCYNRIKEEKFATEEKLHFRLIDINVAKLDVTDPNVSRWQKAKQLTDELYQRLQAGEDFGQLAKEYSHGHRAMFNGLWKPIDPESLAPPYDVLAEHADRMEQAQITKPIAAGQHIFIMKLEENQAANVEPFEKVQDQVRARINFERRKKAMDKLSAKLVQQAAVSRKDEFIDYCLDEIWRLANM